MKVSVVVPTYKRRESLARCLDALAAQNFPPEQFEIVAADNAGEWETRELVQNFAARNKVEINYVWAAAARGAAHARNAGWQAARGAIIAFTDDDCVPDANWLAEAIKIFQSDREISATTGRTIVPLPENPTDYELNESGLERAEFITANCFCRKNVLEETGGFDERFTGAWREDSDLHFRLLENRFKIARVNSAGVVHPLRPAGFGVSLAQQRKSMFDALLYKKHPSLYRRKINFFARRYYLILAMFPAAIVFAFLGNSALSKSFFCLWLFLTARFCLERLRNTSRGARHVLEMIITSILIPPTAIFWRIFGAVKFRVLFF